MKKDEYIGIGLAARLVSAGDHVNVRVEGKTYFCKALSDINSPKVLVVKLEGVLCASPIDSHFSQKTISTNTFFHSQPKEKEPRKNLVYGVVVRVKRRETVNINCACPSWFFDGDRCIQVCDGSGLPSQERCESLYRDERSRRYNPDLYSRTVTYFYRGFLDLLGCPNYENNFFYPLLHYNPNNPYCGDSYLEGYQEFPLQRVSSVATGMLVSEGELEHWNEIYPYNVRTRMLYTSRKGVAPKPVHDFRVSFLNYETTAYDDPDWYYSLSNRDVWDQMYGIRMYRDYTPSQDYGFYQRRSYYNESWEELVQLPTNPNTLPGIGTARYKHIGIPNWIWREIRFGAIFVDNVIYTAPGKLPYQYLSLVDPTRLNQASADMFRRMYYSATGIDIPTELRIYLGPTINFGFYPLPSIVSKVFRRDYTGSTEPPFPPIGPGEWQLLWDTNYCLRDSSPTVPLPYSYDSYDYYLISNVGEPVHLLTARHDEPMAVYISATNYNVEGSIKYGYRSLFTTPYNETYFCKMKIFDSLGVINEYHHFIPNQDQQTIFPDNWLRGLMLDFRGVAEERYIEAYLTWVREGFSLKFVNVQEDQGKEIIYYVPPGSLGSISADTIGYVPDDGFFDSGFSVELEIHEKETSANRASLLSTEDIDIEPILGMATAYINDLTPETATIIAASFFYDK